MMHHYFNPGKFSRFIDKIMLPLALLTCCLFTVGLYYALLASPPDYQQGESVRIMYVHVPSAWMALGVYVSMAISSIALLLWKNPLSDMITRASAPIGAGFTIICLVTGMLWGKPIWGTWWVWDARLTSVLILLFFYIGYMALMTAYEDSDRGSKAGAILVLVGCINIPIIKFSVDWWNTLHQPASILRKGGIAIDGSMLLPLLLMFAAYLSFFVFVLFLRVKTQLLQRKIMRQRAFT